MIGSLLIIVIGIPYLIMVFITMIWTFRAEKYISLNGGKYSYRRAIGNALIGPFYLYNYYYEAFGTLSLNILELPNRTPEIKENLVDEVVETITDSS